MDRGLALDEKLLAMDCSSHSLVERRRGPDGGHDMRGEVAGVVVDMVVDFRCAGRLMGKGARRRNRRRQISFHS